MHLYMQWVAIRLRAPCFWLLASSPEAFSLKAVYVHAVGEHTLQGPLLLALASSPEAFSLKAVYVHAVGEHMLQGPLLLAFGI